MISLVIRLIYLIMGIILLPFTILVTLVNAFITKVFGEDSKVTMLANIAAFILILLSVPVGFYLLFIE